MSFSLDERIDKILEQVDGNDLDRVVEGRKQVKQLLRDFYEYVKLERTNLEPLMPLPNIRQTAFGKNLAIDEMDAKAKEAGL